MRLVRVDGVSIGDDVNGSAAERPSHHITLDPFYMDLTEVTNHDFARFVASTGYRTTAECRERADAAGQATWRTFATAGREQHPVVCVSWHDAVAFAERSGKRLPTEAEWEAAARGGLLGKLYPWGDAEPEQSACNWNHADAAAVSKGQLPTAVSRDLAPNGFGLHSMVGNVWEWCADWYSDIYYSASETVNPQGPAAGEFRVRRGGAWNVRESFRLRCANRGAMPPDGAWANLGFRCAMSLRQER
jgi:formylglycine-generating enzyme required for sulfatase activity